MYRKLLGFENLDTCDLVDFCRFRDALEKRDARKRSLLNFGPGRRMDISSDPPFENRLLAPLTPIITGAPIELQESSANIISLTPAASSSSNEMFESPRKHESPSDSASKRRFLSREQDALIATILSEGI